MAVKKTEQYGNSSISMLKGEERVRKRPAVIFGSDDLEGCKHAVFDRRTPWRWVSMKIQTRSSAISSQVP